MQRDEIVYRLREKPFEPIQLWLSDGRVVTIRHPDQAVVTNRKIIVGLAHIRRGTKLITPADGNTVAKDWMMVDLLHVVSIEPVDGKPTARKRRTR